MTNANVTEKFRSGASVPTSPDQIVTPRRKTPTSPASSSVPRLTTSRDSPSGSGRQCSSWNRDRCQASVRATNETINTTDAPQANSHSGIGRSWRPTSACAAAGAGATSWMAATAAKAAAATRPPIRTRAGSISSG